MINLNFITQTLSVKGLKDLLLDRVMRAFHESFNRTNEDFGFESKPNKDVLDYIKQRESILSEKTMSALHGNLQFELLEGIQGKESITELKVRLSKIFDLEDYKIERIARTETINAFNAGEFHAHVESGVAKWKVWKANVNNSRTAADSLRLHNQVQPIDKPFKDPITGDEVMHSPNRPNCRCHIQYLIKLPKTIKKHGMMYKE